MGAYLVHDEEDELEHGDGGGQEARLQRHASDFRDDGVRRAEETLALAVQHVDHADGDE